MPDDAIGMLEESLQSDDPQRCFDFMISQFRSTRNYRALFEARLMRKRLELGLPLIQRPDLSALPAETQATYGQAVTEAAQEVGELFLVDGEIANAWPYLRATGDTARVAAAIELVEAGETVDPVIEIAFQEGVHPVKGLELIVAKYGICRALTTFGMANVEKNREACIALLARNVHSELVERLGSAIEQEEGSRLETDSIPALIAGRDWLFGEYSCYVDTSHLVSLLQYCPEVTDAGTLRLFHEMCEYGKMLSPQFHVKGQPPFEDVWVDYGHYAQALLGVDVEHHIAQFRNKVAGTELEYEGLLAAQVLVNLLVRLDRFAEALEISLRHLPGTLSAEVGCPSAVELCYLARDFGRLKELATGSGDLLSYAAAGLELRANLNHAAVRSESSFG